MQHHKTICPVSFPFSSTIDDLELVELEFLKDINEGPTVTCLEDQITTFFVFLKRIRLNASNLYKIKNRLNCNLRHASKAWKQCVPRFCYDAIRLPLH